MESEERKIALLDFTSQLPDSIIHHIFSFLSPRDVANASVSSKNWNRAWCTYSYVVFHFIYSNHVVEQNQISDDLHIQRQKQEFLSVMQRSIYRRLKQEFYIKRFQMYIDFPDVQFLAPYLDQWIGIVLGRDVSEFALRVDSSSGGVGSHYNVPKFVMLTESLKVLSLSGCVFVNGIDFKLPNLQKLSLSHCRFSDEFSFQKIISECSVIEYVKISFCELMDSILVKGLPRLKSFEILLCGNVQNIEIHASTLDMFSFALPMDRWPRSIDLRSCIALKELKLSGEGLIGEFALQSLISQVPALEVLELQRFLDLQDFRISSQKLKRLIFRDCGGLSRIEIDTPNLESLEFSNCKEPFLPVNISSETKVHLVFSLLVNSVEFLIRLKDFLFKLSCREDLKLILYNKSKDMIVHEKLSKVSFSSLCHFMHPKRICISPKSYTDLMDELFPTAYPKTLFVIHSSDKLVEQISKELKNLKTHPRLQHKLLGINVNGYEDEEHDEIDLATNLFIEAQTTMSYQTSKITLDWQYNTSKHRIIL